jgi:rare lipoprotein A
MESGSRFRIEITVANDYVDREAPGARAEGTMGGDSVRRRPGRLLGSHETHPLGRWFCLVMILLPLCLPSCDSISRVYRLMKGTVGTTYDVTKGVVKGTIAGGKLVYKIGEFSFKVVMAPLSWPLTRREIQTIDGLPPHDAVKQGRVKNTPYVVHGKRYVPMSEEEARKYSEEGVASWYGYETCPRGKEGCMTANGEVFDPDGLNAAHKLLPLPTHVKVTNLENRRSILLRVNDRGPFVSGRIIDLSAGAARRLGFYERGTARVLVEALDVQVQQVAER